MPDNAKAIGNNPNLKSITEMAIDVHLFDFRISSSVGRHGAVSRFIRVVILIVIMGFCVSF